MTDTQTAAEPGPSTQQAELPFAVVRGEAVNSPPLDLYIPPDALEVFLEAFEGPLDLLLYLIKRQNLDILEVPVAEITRQYMEYIGLMEELRLEVAAEYLVMAAMLAEIKSRMLLPRPVEADSDEDDPRAELIRRLQEYERYKQAAEDVDALPRTGRDTFPTTARAPEKQQIHQDPAVDLKEVLLAFREIMQRTANFAHHHIQMEPLSVRERMSIVLGKVNSDSFTDFSDLFQPEEGRSGVVVTFLAVLELLKESLIELIQTELFAPIHVKARASAEEPMEEEMLTEPEPSEVASS